ncbi:MAG TPA: hypothetical protein VIN71_12830 [Pseudomonadales bacterium]
MQAKNFCLMAVAVLAAACKPFDITINQQENNNIVAHSCQTVPANDANSTPPEENMPPQWAFAEYDSGVTVNDATDELQTVIDLTTISSDPNNDELTYFVVMVTSYGINDVSIWYDAFCVENGVLKVGNLKTSNPEEEFLDDSSGTRVYVSIGDEPDDDLSNTIAIAWYFDNVE